jgi:hypothetical protein
MNTDTGEIKHLTKAQAERLSHPWVPITPREAEFLSHNEEKKRAAVLYRLRRARIRSMKRTLGRRLTVAELDAVRAGL